jgi:tetratricopeptide (TPR) repeat protein
MDESTKQHLYLGREYYAKGDWERAEQMLRLVLDKEDRFADVQNMLGVIAHSRGNFAVAEKHLEAALALNPAYTEAALNLAVTYNDRGKYEKAKEIYEHIQAKPKVDDDKAGLDPFARGRLANMHAELGDAYADVGLTHEAIAEYEKAVTLCPSFADLRTKLGSLLRQVNDLARARTHYEAAIASRPSYVPARVQMGVTLLALGDAPGAEEQWTKVVDLEPDNSQAKMYLRVLHQKQQP